MKISFEQLDYQVNKLYDFSIKDEWEIIKHTEYIRKFIEACGWNVDDYILTMMLADQRKMN